MKTRSIVFFALLLNTGLAAQQLDEASRMLLLSRYEEAKKEIDKVFADPKAKDNPEALLLRTKIYTELFYDSTLRRKYPDAGDQSYNSFKKYVAADPSLKSFLSNNGMRPASIMYYIGFNEGRQLFAQSKWKESLRSFSMTEDIGDFILKNHLNPKSAGRIDTIPVLFAGYAAQNSKDTARAVYYYGKFARENIGGQDYIEVYRYLLNVSMYAKKADEFNAYIIQVRKLYPEQQNLWKAYEEEYRTRNGAVK